MADTSRWRRSIRRWLPRVGSPAAYALGVLLIAIGALVRAPLDDVAVNPLPPFLTLYPMIVLAAFAGGIRVGLSAVVLAAALAWFLWIGPGGGSTSPRQIAPALVYLTTGVLTVLASGGARLLLDEVSAAEEVSASAARELSHRIKNLLAVIQSISRKVAAGARDVPTYRDLLDVRLTSLATAQDILLKRDWGDVALNEIADATLAPFIPNPRIEMRLASNIVVPSAAVTPLSMALYELATNSLKHGGLSNPEGFVRIEARCEEGRCLLEWREIGLPQVAVSESGGLGGRLIRTALSTIEDGAVRYDISPQTVSCVFDWPDKKSG